MNELSTTNYISQSTEKPSLRELTGIKIDRYLPLSQRVRQFVTHVRDPYRFTVNGTIVTINFVGNNSINIGLASAMRAMDEQSARNISTVFTLSGLHESTVA